MCCLFLVSVLKINFFSMNVSHLAVLAKNYLKSKVFETITSDTNFITESNLKNLSLHATFEIY